MKRKQNDTSVKEEPEEMKEDETPTEAINCEYSTIFRMHQFFKIKFNLNFIHYLQLT